MVLLSLGQGLAEVFHEKTSRLPPWSRRKPLTDPWRNFTKKTRMCASSFSSCTINVLEQPPYLVVAVALVGRIVIPGF